MKKLAALAALALAACGPTATTAPEPPPPPPSLMDQAQAMDAASQPVFAYQTLAAYQTAHPDSTPKCERVRQAESRGIVPADVAPNTVYSPFAGALVFSVQCGVQLTTVRNDPKEHWLVVLAPGAMEATIVSCADAQSRDVCVRPIPTAAPAATTGTATTAPAHP